MRIHTMASPRGSIGFQPATLSGPDLTDPSDPINLVFPAPTDVLALRHALLTGGSVSPTEAGIDVGTTDWSDAVGEVQAVFSPNLGTAISTVQLQLGGFRGRRCHLRLFAFPDFTLGAAHFEALPPGSFEHQVLSWSAGEAVVLAALSRAGVVGRVERSQMDPASMPRPLSEEYARDPRHADVWKVGGAPRESLGGMFVPGDDRVAVVHLTDLPAAPPETLMSTFELPLDSRLAVPLGPGPPERRHSRGTMHVEHRVRVSDGRMAVRTCATGTLEVAMTPVDGPNSVPSDHAGSNSGSSTPGDVRVRVVDWSAARLRGVRSRCRRRRTVSLV